MEIGHQFLRHGEKQEVPSHAEIQKARVRAHIAKTKTGKVAQVKEYQRQGKAKPKKKKGIAIGSSVTIPKDLTTDPSKKQGEGGKVTAIKDGVVTVQFADKSKGRYLQEVFGQ